MSQEVQHGGLLICRLVENRCDRTLHQLCDSVRRVVGVGISVVVVIGIGVGSRFGLGFVVRVGFEIDVQVGGYTSDKSVLGDRGAPYSVLTVVEVGHLHLTHATLSFAELLREQILN